MSDIFDPILCSPSGHPALDKWNELINQVAPDHKVPPNLVKAIMMRESAGNPTVISGDLGYGLMQITSGVVNAKYNGVDILNPFTNIKVACRDFIAPLMEEFPDNLDAVIAGYNAGGGAVASALRHGTPLTSVTYALDYIGTIACAYSFFNATSHNA